MAILARATRWLIRGESGAAAVLQTGLLRVATIVVSTATGIIVARALAPSGRGEVSAMTLFPTLLGFILAFGIPSALLYNLKHHAGDVRKLFGASLVAASGMGLLGIIGGYFLLPIALHQYPTSVIQIAQLFLLTIPFTLYLYVGGAAFDSRGQFWHANIILLLIQLTTLVLLSVLVLTKQLNPFTAAASYILPNLFFNLRLVVQAILKFRPIMAGIELIHYQRLLSYGLRSFGIDLLKTLGEQVDTLLVVAFLSPAAMGLYAVSLAISRILQLAQASVVRVLLPKVAARPKDEVIAIVGRAARVTAAVTLIACLSLVILAPLVIRLAYGTKFAAATPVLRVLSIESLFAGATWILAQAFMALGKPGVVSLLQVTGLALSIPLMVLLIPRFGLLGAALSLLMSTLVRFCFILICFPWLLNHKPPRILITSSDIKNMRRRFVGAIVSGTGDAA